MNNNIPQNIIEIEISAEKVYYTIIGKENDMKILLEDINKKNIKKNNNTVYIISKLIVPLANIIEKFNDKNIMLAPETEQVQCSVLCDCNVKEEKEVYTLLCLKDEGGYYSLKFPEIDLKENLEPEKSIIQEMNNIITNVPNPIKNSLRLVDIMGNESDILVYIARASSTKKYYKKK